MTAAERAEEAALVRSWRGPMVTGRLHHPDEARALLDLVRAGQRPAWVYRDLAAKAWGPVRSTVSEEVLSTRSD